jgi:hypothetical protein
LLRDGLGVGLLDADEETALEIEEGVEVEEDVVDLVAADDAPLLDQFLEFLEEFEMLDVGALRLDQLVDDVLALGALGGAGHVLQGRGGSGDLTLGDQLVQHAVDYISDLSVY